MRRSIEIDGFVVPVMSSRGWGDLTNFTDDFRGAFESDQLVGELTTPTHSIEASSDDFAEISKQLDGTPPIRILQERCFFANGKSFLLDVMHHPLPIEEIHANEATLRWEGLTVDSVQPPVVMEKASFCIICGWIHNDSFTKFSRPGEETMSLVGIQPDIVRVVHAEHAKGLPGIDSKDKRLQRVLGGYGAPSNAFYSNDKRAEYKRLFDTSKRGTLRLRIRPQPG